MKCVVVNLNTYIIISSLIEMYDNGDLNLVPKKIMKKNIRRIPYREFVFIKC